MKIIGHYWTGAAVVSSGVLLFFQSSAIIDALAEMEVQEASRHSSAYAVAATNIQYRWQYCTASAVPKFPSNTQPSRSCSPFHRHLHR